MDPTTIALVQSSWSQVKPAAASVGPRFYANLFDADPALQALFKGDLTQQAAKLVQMVDVAVARLGQPEVLLPVLQQLGRRHQGYGVQPAHYATVGGALLKTLEQGLGPAFTPEVRAAWATVYGAMAGAMAPSP